MPKNMQGGEPPLKFNKYATQDAEKLGLSASKTKNAALLGVDNHIISNRSKQVQLGEGLDVSEIKNSKSGIMNDPEIDYLPAGLRMTEEEGAASEV